MKIEQMIKSYQLKGYEYQDAVSKVSQDIILYKISKSRFSKNITIKGGVVMHNISKNIRRATRDIDLDFIKYSLDDFSIKKFIEIINTSDNDTNIEISGTIVPLHHQDYDGKRVAIKISDKYDFSINSKLDIGIHKNFDINQDEYCFAIDTLNKNVSLLINSKEQMFTEKMKSLLKLGRRSTRYKDLFDFYYLINIAKLDRERLIECINILIFKDENMRENNIEDIKNRINKIMNSNIYMNNLSDPKVNWLDVSANDVISSILHYLESLEKVSIE